MHKAMANPTVHWMLRDKAAALVTSTIDPQLSRR